MLQLGLVVPAERAEKVVGLLRGHRGVATVLHLPGAAVQPAGDLVQADVAREAANELIEILRPHLHRADGVLTVTDLSTSIGGAVETAEAEAPGEPADAVIWDQVEERTSEEATLSATFLVFLIAAMLISSVGILTDSSVLVVGGMVLGPEFGPLAAIAVALVHRRGRHAFRSAVALLVGFPVGIAVTAGAVAVLRWTVGLPADYLDGDRPLTSFISHPDVFSVVVALIAGVAGMVSLTSAKSGPLIGVFISVTTIPAAANVGTALVTDHLDEAAGAAIQLLVNIACLLVAAVATLAVQRAVGHALRRRRAPRGRERTAGRIGG